MKIEQLLGMVTIVEQGSLRAAARHLGLDQPALTKSIRALERELGVVLFERDPRGMVLTASGRLLYQRASLVVNELRRARDELQQAAGGGEGTLTAGLSIMPHVGLLPHVLPEFKRRYPLVKLKLIEGLFPDLEGRLRNGALDFFIGASPRQPPAPGLVSTLLFENTRVVVGRKGHPLARAGSLAELQDAEWATPSLDYNAEEDLNGVFASHGLQPPRVMLQAASALSLMVALSSTDLLAFLPRQWSEFALAREALQAIPIRERIPAPAIVMIRRPDLPLMPAAEYFSDLLLRFAPRDEQR
ncbi:LysR substrate-binding domain-containing protein [Azohydromonas caseinilytica]|uniref:LysR family transcriptional regulator n=1 Tax=Azohydromonas caseinilytica TaxID=2728836 RepID=A0A848F8K1_9BURK|nr:LysR substrate-binding domain-containing protein [Azohydromonas caseinilytica]NML16467.1 LysR family transcriptional regulator [Azohydromonas caseinilytica]